MRNQRHTCSDELLMSILTDRDSMPDIEMTLDQVEQCPKCRLRLEELAADEKVWQRAQQVLAGFTSSTAAFRARQSAGYPASSNVAGHFNQQHEGWAESLASQLLGPPSHPEMLGRIGRYEVERLIGSGGMGIVFKAIDTELNRHVAIKILAPYLAGNGSARQRFSREAKAAAAVVHEHVVPIYNVESDGESPFLVMHYVAGDSLQARIDREGPLELCEILRIGMQVSAGLEAAHLQGLVHRDIKPANILLEQGVERSLITDFGLARTTDDASLTNTGYYAGTPQYMSPEQVRGDTIDFRSDLFSLGSMIYAMGAGRPPFRAETTYGVLRKITDTEPRSLQEINPRIPAWLEQIVEKLIAKAPADRFKSAEEVAGLLKECLAHVQRPTTNPLPVVLATAARKKPRRIGRRIMALLACIPLIAIGVWFNAGYFRSMALQLGPAINSLIATEQDGSAKPDQRPVETKPRKVARSFQLTPDPADKIRQKLSQSIEINSPEMQLREVADSIATAVDTTVDLNEESLAEVSVALTQRINVAGTTTARSLLRRVCNERSLAYIVHENSIEIVTASYAQAHPVLRYYELAYVMHDSQGLANLVMAIESLIAPSDWKTSGGDSTIAIVESVLVVRTTEAIHGQIEQLLSQIARGSP